MTPPAYERIIGEEVEMSVMDELYNAAQVLAEGWMQRNHPDSAGVEITDEQMAEAAYTVRGIFAVPPSGFTVSRS